MLSFTDVYSLQTRNSWFVNIFAFTVAVGASKVIENQVFIYLIYCFSYTLWTISWLEFSNFSMLILKIITIHILDKKKLRSNIIRNSEYVWKQLRVKSSYAFQLYQKYYSIVGIFLANFTTFFRTAIFYNTCERLLMFFKISIIVNLKYWHNSLEHDGLWSISKD